MKPSAIICQFLKFVLCFQVASALAFETDQYNLPPTPLADIGREVSEYAEANVRKAVSKINAEIFFNRSCIERRDAGKTRCNSRAFHLEKLKYLSSDEAVAREVFKLLGDGIMPFTRAGTYMDSHEFVGRPARYRTSYGKSVFVLVPTNYLTISPTVRLYGVEFGTDKIAHFFQQGFTYYKIFNSAVANGLPPDEAVKKAVKWGRMSERTFFGTLVSGVFSNADLYANYVGMKFYLGLTFPVKIGNELRPAILLLKHGIWVVNNDIDLHAVLIKPFLTNHMNEALNPSLFIPGLRSSVRRIVKKRSCPAWLKLYPKHSQADLQALSESLRLWNGEDYGFKPSKRFVTVVNTCFASDSSAISHLPVNSFASSPAS